jgi:hypothetical protein
LQQEGDRKDNRKIEIKIEKKKTEADEGEKKDNLVLRKDYKERERKIRIEKW